MLSVMRARVRRTSGPRIPMCSLRSPISCKDPVGFPTCPGVSRSSSRRLKDNGIEPVSFVASGESMEKTKDDQLAFANKRAEVWWKFREALDPDQPDGSAIALPPDPELRADLCAPTWKLGARGILLESKDEIRKRLGRSPGKGDAVVMCWSEGNAAAVSRQNAWKWERYRGQPKRWIV